MAEQPRPRRHLVLVGLMGSGKSTVGRKVAKALDRPFRDADHELEARTGRSVRSWFESEGEAGFRAAETDVLRALLADPGASVIAAGGGVVVTEANRVALRDAVVVWLDADPTFLAGRIGQRTHRPLLDDDTLGTLLRLHGEREGWYREVADIVVEVAPVHDSAAKPKKELAALVVARLRALDGGDEPTAGAGSGSGSDHEPEQVGR